MPVTGRGNKNSINPADDAVFFFQFDIEGDQDVQEFIDQYLERILQKKDEFRAVTIENFKKVRTIFNFILNCLLYITGADVDIEFVDRRTPLIEKYNRCTGSKMSKLARMISNCESPYYDVGSKIILSREEKEAYSSGETGNKIKSRTLVQGFWRNQSFGVKHSLRKMLWIMPFWRGPEFAEAVHREHVVK